MVVDRETLQLEFNNFKKSIIGLSNEPFLSFEVGLPYKWEAYKRQVRSDALNGLSVDNWSADLIGTGKILSNVIEAIEVEQNNLLNWRSGRHGGPESRVHHILHEPGSKTIQLEQWFFEFYKSTSNPSTAFDQFTQLANRNYSLIAYLFFLKDEFSFMPIATTTFDTAFARLGIDLKMSHRCGWENYSRYNHALQAIREGLESHCGVKNPTLLDAHSFCWMMIDMERELEKPKQKPPSAKKASKVIHITDKWPLAIHTMVENATKAVKQSGSTIAEKTAKTKTSSMDKSVLEKYVTELLEAQDHRCALSGIHLNPVLDGESSDMMLYPSLDRIDSEIGYEVGNLQVVCRFLNQWKSDQNDDEFRRLIALLVSQYSDTQSNELKRIA